jgi:hypothetical protein
VPKASFSGCDLFMWDKWEEIDCDTVFFYNVTFFPASLQKYNGLDVEIPRNRDNGNMVIWNGKQKQEEVDLFSVPEFAFRIAKENKKGLGASVEVIGGDPKNPQPWKGILSDLDIAVGKEFKARAEVFGAMAKEGVGFPHVQDEQGNWMSREQLIQREQDSWMSDMVKNGWPPLKIIALKELLG